MVLTEKCVAFLEFFSFKQLLKNATCFKNLAEKYTLIFNRTHKSIHYLFSDVNKELNNINQWFAANKPSLHIEKSKYSFFHKRSKKDNIPLRLPNSAINNRKIKREESIKFH